MIDSVHMTPTIKTPLPGQPLELKSPLMNPPMLFSNQMIQMPQMAINQSLMFPGTMANTPRMNAPVNRQPNQSSPFSPQIFSSPVHPLNCNQNQNMQYFQNPNFQNQTCQNPNFQNPAFFQNSGIPTQLSISTPLMMTPTSLHPNMSFNSFNFQSPLPMQYPYATSTVLATPSLITTPGMNVLQTPIYTQGQPNAHFVFPNQSMINTLASKDTPGFVKSMLNENNQTMKQDHEKVQKTTVQAYKLELENDQKSVENKLENLDQNSNQIKQDRISSNEIVNLEMGVQKLNLENNNFNGKAVSNSPSSEWAAISLTNDQITSSGFHSTGSTSRQSTSRRSTSFNSVTENRSISSTQLSNADKNLEGSEQQGTEQQGSDKPWMNNRIKKAIGKRQEAYTKQKEAERVIEQYIDVHGERCELREAALEETKRIYKKKRNLVVTLTRVAKKQYEDKGFQIPPRFKPFDINK